MARTLLKEKEEDMKALVAKLNVLQEEVDSGAPTERKVCMHRGRAFFSLGCILV